AAQALWRRRAEAEARRYRASPRRPPRAYCRNRPAVGRSGGVEGQAMFKKILVAVDLLDPSKGKRILEVAAGLAPSADIRLVYVRYMMEAALKYVDRTSLAEEEKAAVAELVALAAEAALPADRVSAVSPMGNAADRIL